MALPEIADVLQALSLSDPEYLLFGPSREKLGSGKSLMTICSEYSRQNHAVRLTGPGKSPWMPAMTLKIVE
jgi:hypothetical protein